MKLKTILAVAATSIGLLSHAAGYADKAMSFEGSSVIDGEAEGVTWTYKADEVTLTPYAVGETQFSPRATQFAGAGQDKYLAIKTPLTNGIVRAAQTTIDGEIFVDTLVKFTAVDVGDTVDVPDDAKVAVWVQAQDETDTPVNHIMVTAGSDKTVYDCGSIENLDQWHRLTIKVIGDVTAGEAKNGIVIYLDGSKDALVSDAAKSAFDGMTLSNVAAEYKKNGQLFPAIQNGQTFNSVEFAGQGAIDDVVFTETPEDFAKDFEFYTIAWDDGVTGFTYTPYNGSAVTKTDLTAAGELSLVWDGSNVPGISAVTYAQGKMAADNEVIKGKTTIKSQALLASGTIDGEVKNFATVQQMVDALNSASEAQVALGGDIAGGLTINNEIEDSVIVIDLMGKTITGAAAEAEADPIPAIWVTSGNVTIKDTVGTGKVVAQLPADAGEDVVAIAVLEDGDNALVTIEAGTYEGQVSVNAFAANTETLKVCTAYNVADELAEVEGYVWTEAENYYVLVAKPTGPFSGGTGAEDDPYQIANEKDLVDLADYTAKNDTTGVYFKQTDDITLTEVIKPIGADNNKDNANTTGKADDFKAVAFKGIYDGDTKTISNVVLPRADYTGVFGSTFGATIKNLKVACAGFDSNSEAANYGGALIAGTTVETTIEGCEVSGSATATKAIAGIVGYACEGTVVKDCVNKANLKSANEKVGGIIGCAQNGDAFGGKTVGEITVDGCTSEGNLECTTEGKTYVGGLVSYTDSKVVFKGANVVSGTLTQAGSTTPSSVIALSSGSVELDEGATFAVPAGIQTVTKNPVDGLIFATVDGNVATLVKNAALAFGNEYQVMATGASYTFAAAGSISFDTTLATPTVTAADGLVLSGPTGETAVKTWSARAYVPVTGVTLDITSTNVAPNATFTLTATVAPDGADDAEITWTTSDATIATVVNGEVTALADGKATIKATNAKTGLFASCEVTVKADGPVVPVGPGEVTPKGEENKATIAEAFGDNLAKWVEDVYGAGGAIPAAKLNATTPALIAAAKEFNLPIMTEAVTVTVEAAAEGFTFKIVDGEPINVQKANLQKLVKYTAELGTTAFGDSTDKVDFENNGTSFDAKFTTPDAAAGFMKVDMTAE